jgi:hypothetical protein
VTQRDFDPRDPPRLASQNPLREYQRPPEGLSALTIGQFALAALMLVRVGLVRPEVRAAWGAGEWLLALYPAGVFGLAATGIALRRGWGWWVTCAIYFYMFFNLPVALAVWTIKGGTFEAANNLIIFGLAVGVLAYINRPQLLRFIRFRTPDGRPGKWARATPILAGAIGAAVRLGMELGRG